MNKVKIFHVGIKISNFIRNKIMKTYNEETATTKLKHFPN